MIPSIRTRLLSALLLLLSWTGAHAQYGLGPSQLLDPPAPALGRPSDIKIKLTSPGYVGRVGGVAFGGKAEPAPTATFKSLSLDYRPEEKDGQRLWVVADGRRFSAQIYDWQMAPIAEFANSQFTTCVTLFGELDDPAEQKNLARGASVINYHAAFVNKLVGLRLFQLDILINDSEAVHLPTRPDRTYVLGEGETPPDIAANEKGWEAVRSLRHRLYSELKVRTSSYIVTDEGRATRFDFEGGSLRLTGDPYIYFWLYKKGMPDYSLLSAYVSASRDVLGAAAASASPAARRQAYTAALLRQLNQPDANYDEGIMSPTVEALLAREDKQAQSAYIATLSTDDIRDAAIDLHVLADMGTVVPLKDYTERLSSEPGLLRSINPTVWDTGVNVMRYAAFFRYVKEKHPKQWESFYKRVSQLRPEPVVSTPTVFQRSKE